MGILSSTMDLKVICSRLHHLEIEDVTQQVKVWPKRPFTPRVLRQLLRLLQTMESLLFSTATMARLWQRSTVGSTKIKLLVLQRATTRRG